MPTTPINNSIPAETPAPAGAVTTAFLALRDRSRSLLRERSAQLHELELKLQEQVTLLMAELDRPKPEPEPEPEPVVVVDSTASSERIVALEAEVRHLQQLRSESEQALDDARLMLVEMEDERRALRERMDADEPQHAPQQAPPSPAPSNDAELERLQRRLEMAMQEIRELKQQNSELASRPKQPATPQRATEDAKSFDWETQKQRLLQQLETDFDEAKPDQAQAKLQIEDVIRKTDRIIAEKNRELDELRELLEQRSVESGTAAQDAASREELFDSDKAILAERERLTQVQNEWREKLRKSEVEISIERAKLARERLQLDEKLRSLPPGTTPDEDSKNKPPDDTKNGGAPRGRWLTRLGLGGNE